ncbi:MAG: lipid-A-disaccharide synthase [Vulcanimicrobiaceae bacterium]
MRYFFSTGEASGEMSATLLAGAINSVDSGAVLEGIGSERMRDAGFALWTDTRGWSSMGPMEALARIPKLYSIMWVTALRLLRRPPALIVLVDFGAFNLRLAKTLRMLGYRRPILYFFPPGAWLDNPKQARSVAGWTTPLVAFEHQAEFYRALGLPVEFFGHPLTASTSMRPARPAPPPDGGTVALLPGSRMSELRYHVPVLLQALQLLRSTRPHLRTVIGAADASAHMLLQRAVEGMGLGDVQIMRSARAALADADAAWIASGTAVIEAALGGVPSVALYILSQTQARIARRVYHGTFITIPNLVLKKAVSPELLQEAATPQALSQAMESVLRDPAMQYAQLWALRAALGPDDALQQAARFAVALGRR